MASHSLAASCTVLVCTALHRNNELGAAECMPPTCCAHARNNVHYRASQGLIKAHDADPSWRNEADCGFQTFTPPNTTGQAGPLPLNCAGPRRMMWRCVCTGDKRANERRRRQQRPIS